jgi:transcriptional antiterminator RfaH
MEQVNAHESPLFWFVAQTGARAEQKAHDFLSQKAVTTYLPKLLVRHRHGSRRWQALEPLFPGYIFTRFAPTAETIYRVRWTPGIARLLGDEEMPIPVPDEVVQYLQRREEDRGFISPGQPFAPGDRVRFRRGPFTMLEGIIDRPAARSDRVRVLLHLVNMSVAVEVDTDVLEVG